LIDENDLKWKVPVFSLLLHLILFAVLLFVTIILPICGLPVLLLVAGRFILVNFVVNKKKKLALQSLYFAMNSDEKQYSFLSRYYDIASSLVNFFFSSFDRIEDYRVIHLKPEDIEMFEVGGFNFSPIKKTYHKINIEKIVLQDMKLFKVLYFDIKDTGTGKTERLQISSLDMRHFDMFEQHVRSYYPEAFLR
jgi:hypothetical protein